MTTAKTKLNTFLVEVFHDILRLESDSLRDGGFLDLSVSEMHLLEAVGPQGGCGMGELAQRLSLSAGSVTTAVKALERKGYLTRSQDADDRRRVVAALTPRALLALHCHRDFHKKLVASITKELDAAQLDALGEALSTLHGFFNSL